MIELIAFLNATVFTYTYIAHKYIPIMSILYIHTEHMYMHIIYTYIMQIGHNAINSAKDKILRNNNKYAVAVQSLSHV